MTTVVVAGALAAKPGNGGEAWVRLSWVLGLRRLGIDAWLVEQVDGPTAAAGREFFADVVRRFELESRSLLLEPNDGSHARCRDLAGESALLVNISGNLSDEDMLRRFARRVYVDLDPGFTQTWHRDGQLGRQLDGYDGYFTVGLNIGSPDCLVPTAGIEWLPLPPPVVLGEWTPMPERRFDRFTTIATWRNAFGPVEIDGRTFGLKHHEFRRIADIPRRADARFELALDIDPADGADLRNLAEQGWSVVDPLAVAGDPAAFRDYVRGAGAEFSATQGIYADGRTGWISDRTAHFLAAGRPAVVQQTQLPSSWRTGEGLLGFSDLPEALAAVNKVVDEYALHAEAARAFAEDHFDSDRVLSRALELAGVE